MARKNNYEEYIDKRLNSKEAKQYNEDGMFSEFVSDLKYDVSQKYNITESKASIYVDNRVKKKSNIYGG